MSADPPTIAVLTPVLDDWESLGHLLRDIETVFGGTAPLARLHIYAVDDGSTLPFVPGEVRLSGDVIDRITILHLALNLGHQRAIAVGLAELSHQNGLDGIFVMDSDGEDRPQDMPLLLDMARRMPGRIIVASRGVRSETRTFRAGYIVYRALFRLLTGRIIRFGNFSYLPAACLKRLSFMPEIWNNLAAAITRSRIAYSDVPTRRGLRYAGQSRMNFVSLITHGLSAISVHIDAVFVRMLLGAGVLTALTILGIVVAVTIRFATDLAIPGWTTNVVAALMIMLMQAIIIVVTMLFTVLAGRNIQPIVPRNDVLQFIAERRHFVVGPEGLTKL